MYLIVNYDGRLVRDWEDNNMTFESQSEAEDWAVENDYIDCLIVKHISFT